MCSDDDDELFAGFTAPKGLSGQPSHQHQHPHQKTTTTAKVGGSSKKGGPLPSSGNGSGSGSPPPVVAGRAPTQAMSKGTGIEGYNARPGGSVRYMGGVRGGREHDADEEEGDDDFNGMEDFDMGGDGGDGDDEYSRDKVKSNHHTAAASSSSSSVMHRNDKNAVTGGSVGFGGPGPAVLSSASIHTNNKGSNHSTMSSTGHGSNSSQNHNNAAVMASSSTTTSTSTTGMSSTSRVVMKPGQRPFVRAGGSNSRKPIPPQTTST